MIVGLMNQVVNDESDQLLPPSAKVLRSDRYTRPISSTISLRPSATDRVVKAPNGRFNLKLFVDKILSTLW